MAKLTEYPQALTFDANDILIKDGTNGTKKITVEDAAKYFSQYTNTNIASGFSAQTAYTKGAYVLKDGVLYRFTENHPAGAWSTSDTTEIKLASDMSALAALLDETNAAVVSVEGDVASILGIIAPYVSATMTAPSNITSGEYVLANGVLYRATANIASGSTLTPNGNVVAVTIGEELFEVIKSNAKKADTNGTYDEMTVGQSKQLLSGDTVEDQTPYIMRTSGGALEISDREKNTIVGGTIAWNQQVNKKTINYTSENLDVASQNDGKWTATIRGSVSASANVTSMRGGAFPVGHKVLYLSGNDTVQVRYKTPTNIVTPKIVSIPSTWTATSYNVTLDYPEGTTGTFDLYPVAFDLTQMFGTTIADYIYSLEQETAGAGVAWFKKLFPKDYYAYDTGSLQSVQTSAHKMVGFNVIPEQMVNHKRWSNGVLITSDTAAAVPVKMRVIPGMTYCFTLPNKSSSVAALYITDFDANENFIRRSAYINIAASSNHVTFTASYDAQYIGVDIYKSGGFADAEIVNANLNLSFNDEKDGTYEPYVEYNYPLDDSLTLYGFPKLDGNNRLYYDGDTYESDGTVTRRAVSIVFDGAGESWNQSGVEGNDKRYFLLKIGDYGSVINSKILSPQYMTTEISGSTTEIGINVLNSSAWNGAYIYIRPNNVSDMSIANFKALLAENPVEVVYLLADGYATTETAEPYAEFQTVSNLGTEEYIDAGVAAGTRDVEIPVGNITEYYQDLRAKLESAPDSPDDDGDYILRRSSGENAYTRAEPIFAGKANTEGDYPNLIAGGAQQLMSTVGIEDQVPYNFRTSGGTADIGDREEDMVVGGTIVWNQQIQNGNFADTSGWSVPTASTFTVENGKATISGATTSYTRIQRISSKKSYANHKYLIMLKASSSSGKVALLPMGGSAGGIFNFTGLTEESQIAMIWAPSEDYTTVTWHIRFNTTTSGVSEDITATVRDYCAFDLTQMFGTAIADYIYSLEQANAGDGVAWFKKLFPKEYYAYDTGTLQSVQTSAHKMVGFNAWDEEWESGTIQSANGQNAPDANRIRSKNYVPVVPNQPYYLKAPQYAIIYQYDSDKNFLGTTGSRGDNRISVFSSSTSYVRFAVGSSSDPVTTYDNDICLNLSWDGEKDGTYEPYVEYSYPLDDSLTLYGFPKLDENNRLYYDGDTYESDGTVTRKFGMVDLGTLSFTYRESVIAGQYVFAFALPSDATAATGAASTKGIICPIYTTFYNARTDGTGYASFNMSIYRGTTRSVYIRNDDYTDAAAFKAAMSGVYLIYELATPTTETAEPYTNPQIVNDFGTEEYVDAGVEAETRDVAIPVGHETFYLANLRAKLEMSPESPDGDGDYIVRQANGENTYVPLVIPNELPAAPSTDGTYVLHATVADGVLTYSWVADT